MTDWKTVLIEPTCSIVEAIRVINQGAMQIGMVTGPDGRLLGTITDGDIRRAILDSHSLESPVETIMNRHPTTVGSTISRREIIGLMRRKALRQMPVVDEDGRVVDLKILMRLLDTDQRDNAVLLMAGGLGNRLRPMTEDCPKPLLKVGGRPILETIISNFKSQGFSNFWIATHYKGEMIEAYFGDGSESGVHIEYLREESQLGTAGALTLIPEKPRSPMIVMNGDVLTNIDFTQLLDFHLENRASATMCVRKYDFQVPYGVVGIAGNTITCIEEKPVHSFFVNAGIYVLDPDAVAMVPTGESFDMTQLFDVLIGSGKTTAAFPIHEYWLDVGRPDDFRQANGDYGKHF